METAERKPQRIAQIQSVERAIWILKSFEGHNELSLTEISRSLGLHKSTTFGLVSTLVAYRLLEQDAVSGKYRLGIELFRLGSGVNIDLRGIVAPFLDRLVNSCGETVNLVVPDGHHIVYIEKKESPHSMRIATSLGHREPLYRTAAGKAILAKLSPEAARARLENTVFERATDKTLLSADAVLRQLDEIRRTGYAVDNEEMEYGLICLGVALLDYTGNPVGAVSVSGPASRMTAENQNSIARQLIECCEQIGRQL